MSFSPSQALQFPSGERLPLTVCTNKSVEGQTLVAFCCLRHLTVVLVDLSLSALVVELLTHTVVAELETHH